MRHYLIIKKKVLKTINHFICVNYLLICLISISIVKNYAEGEKHSIVVNNTS